VSVTFWLSAIAELGLVFMLIIRKKKKRLTIGLTLGMAEVFGANA
jgi:hypothetical protein